MIFKLLSNIELGKLRAIQLISSHLPYFVYTVKMGRMHLERVLQLA